MNIRRLFKLVLVISILSWSFIPLKAQGLDDYLNKDWWLSQPSQVETILNIYIHNGQEHQEKIRNVFSKWKEHEQMPKIHVQITDTITSLLEAEKIKLADKLIELYKCSGSNNDPGLLDLYFIRGVMRVNDRDVEGLKAVVSDMNAMSDEVGSAKREYINQLSAKLAQLEQRVATLEELKGWWVSDITPYKIIGSNTPYFFFYIDGTPKTGYTCKIKLYKSGYMVHRNIEIEDKLEQSKFFDPYEIDSVFIAFATREIKKPNLFLAQLSREFVRIAGGTFAGEFSQRNKYSGSRRFWSKMGGAMVEGMLNSMISSLFSPSRTDYLLTFNMQMVNDRVMKGKFHYERIKQSAYGDSEKSEDIQMNFYRWDPDVDVVFPLFSPYIDDLSKYKKMPNTVWAEFKATKPGGSVKNYRAFAHDMLRRIIYDNYNKLLNSDWPHNGVFEKEEIGTLTPDLGVDVKPITPELVAERKLKLSSGLLVLDVSELSPAYYHNIEKDDVIQEVNGRAVNKAEDLSAALDGMKPGDFARVKVMKKKGKAPEEMELFLEFVNDNK